jgi:voltage-gated potassium channel
MWFVVDGTADVFVAPPGERGLGSLVAQLGPEQFFGEAALLTDESRSATVRASSEMDLFVVSRSNLQRVMDNHTGLEDALRSTIEERRGDL